MKERFKDRYFLLGIFFVMIGLVIVATLANYQIIQGKKLDSDAQKRLPNIRTIIAPRGNIEDRNGVPIAINRVGFSLQILKAGLDSQELNAMLLNLANIMEKNGDSYYKTFKKYITISPLGFGSRVKDLKNPVEAIKKEFLLKPDAGVVLKTPSDVFNYLRKKKYSIDDRYSDADAYKIITLRYEIRDYGSIKPVILAEDISKETVAEVEERHHDFPGVSTDTAPLRQYVDAYDAAHVLGYIRGISEEEYAKLKDQGYGMNDLIGKTGIELAAEKYLRGTDGYKSVEVNTVGRLTEEINTKPAIPGDKVILTLDMKLQKIAMESLKKNTEMIKNRQGNTGVKENHGDANAASVVALDVNTGEVLVDASYPSYDPSIFLAGADDKVAQKAIEDLLLDKSQPQWNRTIQSFYAPGSTFKPVVGVAGLEEGVITPTSTINDPGIITVEGTKLKCLEYVNHTKPNGHGNIDLEEALATSCNMFFYKLGMELGSNKIDKWAKIFGLGEKTGIDIGGEVKGIRSNMEYHYSINPKNAPNPYKWGSVLTAITSIGQLYNNFTPIQLANYTATIANGGKRFVPHLIKRIVKYDGTVVSESKNDYYQVPVKKETVEAVKRGMLAVANSSEGTAAGVFADFTANYGITVAGKTGTAETTASTVSGNGSSNNGVFICYAPADNPRIAIAIVTEKGVWGKFSAPVAKDILSEYFNVNKKGIVDEKAKPDTVELTR